MHLINHTPTRLNPTLNVIYMPFHIWQSKSEGNEREHTSLRDKKYRSCWKEVFWLVISCRRKVFRLVRSCRREVFRLVRSCRREVFRFATFFRYCFSFILCFVLLLSSIRIVVEPQFTRYSIIPWGSLLVNLVGCSQWFQFRKSACQLCLVTNTFYQPLSLQP